MPQTKILKFIGKGQITIPQKWKECLNLDQKLGVKSYIDENKIIIEKIPMNTPLDWEIENISLNTLPINDQKLVKEGRKQYRHENEFFN